MKIRKGDYGYIRSQKIRRLGRTAALFALAFGIFAVGMILNHGDRKNIYSIVAAVGTIPGAMSLVSTIMMWMRHPVSEELHEEIARHGGDLRILYELYLTTRDINLFLDATVVCGPYVTAYSSEKTTPQNIHFMEEHIRKSLMTERFKESVKIFSVSEKDKFLERVDQIRAKREELETDQDDQKAAVLQAIAL
ncbi:MAG: hypothetical protein ACOYBF_02965 [Bilifractor porci]|jgi:hypothetical protein